MPPRSSARPAHSCVHASAPCLLCLRVRAPSAELTRVAPCACSVFCAQMLFSQSRRPELKKEKPELSFGEMGKARGAHGAHAQRFADGNLLNARAARRRWVRSGRRSLRRPRRPSWPARRPPRRACWRSTAASCPPPPSPWLSSARRPAVRAHPCLHPRSACPCAALEADAAHARTPPVQTRWTS